MGIVSGTIKLSAFVFWSWVLYTVAFSVYKRNIHQADWSAYEGEWAVVTGASTGIGREFAKQLAARGIHVLLTARRENLLQKAVEDINGGPGTGTARYLVADVLDDAAWPALGQALEDLPGPVTILVNNVGGGDTSIDFFIDTDMEAFERNMKLNQESFVRATYVVLPHMLKHGKGRIINVASLSSFGAPGMMSYSMAKAAMTIFTQNLNAEYELEGIRSEAITPGWVETPIIGYRSAEDNFDTCTPTQLVDATLQHWGLEEVHSPYFAHAVLQAIITNVPVFVRDQMFLDSAEEAKVVVEAGLKVRKAEGATLA